MNDSCTNVVIAGLGGQGIITASDILAQAAFLAGLDVKKSDSHGMSQRGGSVTSDVRFGRQVFSPMVPAGEADFLVLLAPDQLAAHGHVLRGAGRVIASEGIDAAALPHRRSLNVALLGVLSRHLAFEVAAWHEAIRQCLRPELVQGNLRAFELGRGP